MIGGVRRKELEAPAPDLHALVPRVHSPRHSLPSAPCLQHLERLADASRMIMVIQNRVSARGYEAPRRHTVVSRDDMWNGHADLEDGRPVAIARDPVTEERRARRRDPALAHPGEHLRHQHRHLTPLPDRRFHRDGDVRLRYALLDPRRR